MLSLLMSQTPHTPGAVRMVGDVMIWASAILSTSFCVLYQLTAPWRRSVEGRHVMTFVAAIAAVCDLIVLRLIIGDSVCFQVLRTLTFASVPFVLGWRVLLLYRVQIKPRLELKKTEEKAYREAAKRGD